MLSKRAAVLMTSFLLLLGCAYSHLEQPTLTVIDVNLLKGDLFRQQLRVRMRVENPNDVALPVQSISYEVELAGNAFAHGESAGDFIVPAKGGTEFDVNVTANAAAAVLQMLGKGGQDNLQYRIFGKVHLSSGILRNVPFDHTGTFRLR
ncbi:MAG: LEA type 2 family protein [Pseudomonadota bacterium]